MDRKRIVSRIVIHKEDLNLIYRTCLVLGTTIRVDSMGDSSSILFYKIDTVSFPSNIRSKIFESAR